MLVLQQDGAAPAAAPKEGGVNGTNGTPIPKGKPQKKISSSLDERVSFKRDSLPAGVGSPTGGNMFSMDDRSVKG